MLPPHLRRSRAGYNHWLDVCGRDRCLPTAHPNVRTIRAPCDSVRALRASPSGIGGRGRECRDHGPSRARGERNSAALHARAPRMARRPPRRAAAAGAARRCPWAVTTGRRSREKHVPPDVWKSAGARVPRGQKLPRKDARRPRPAARRRPPTRRVAASRVARRDDDGSVRPGDHRPRAPAPAPRLPARAPRAAADVRGRGRRRRGRGRRQARAAVRSCVEHGDRRF